MTYRQIIDLTDDEIKFILNDILKPNSIRDIVRYPNGNAVMCKVSTTWFNRETGEDYASEDTVVLDEDTINVTIPLEAEEEYRYKQYLMSKGCNRLLKCNPYMGV